MISTILCLEEAVGSPVSIKYRRAKEILPNMRYTDADFATLDVWHVEFLIEVGNRQVLQLDFLRHSVLTWVE